MYANFIYVILAILIYSAYQPADRPYFAPLETLLLAAVLLLAFLEWNRRSFARVLRLASTQGNYAADHRFSAVLGRQSIAALVVFALAVHVLALPLYVLDLPLVDALPVLAALLFMGLFLGLLALVWRAAFPAHRRLYDPAAQPGAYVASNLRLTIPILLPWIAISALTDIIFALPFETPKRLLSTTAGEAAFFLGFLVLVAFTAPLFVQKFWGCRPLEEGYYRRRIRELCQRAGVGYRDILYWPIFGGRMITAGVMGLARRFRFILVTEALLQTLSPEEVDSVVAHEIGHVKHHHLPYYMLFMAGFMLLVFALYDAALFLFLYGRPTRWLLTASGLPQASVLSLLFAGAFLTLFLVYFRFVFGYYMRNFERQSDAYVYTLFDSAAPMIATFRKIAAASGQSDDKPNWHHFSIRERIDFLARCEADRRWVAWQNRKVRRSLGLYLAALAVVAGLAWQLNVGEAGRRLNRHFLEDVLQREIAQQPENAELQGLLGDVKYAAGDLAGAAEAYEAALALVPGNPQVLNNLAWLYATAEAADVRQPARALELARRAVQLDPSAQVLDTLGECYFVNGRMQEAVAAGREALARAADNREYFREQLEKFEKALAAGGGNA
jgi:Zn-dependent protease with chaperone function